MLEGLVDNTSNAKKGDMAQKVKQFSLAIVAGILGSILVIFTFTDRVTAYADKHIDQRIEYKTKEICVEQQKNVKVLAQAIDEIKLVTVRLETQAEAQERYLEYLERNK